MINLNRCSPTADTRSPTIASISLISMTFSWSRLNLDWKLDSSTWMMCRTWFIRSKGTGVWTASATSVSTSCARASTTSGESEYMASFTTVTTSIFERQQRENR